MLTILTGRDRFRLTPLYLIHLLFILIFSTAHLSATELPDLPKQTNSNFPFSDFNPFSDFAFNNVPSRVIITMAPADWEALADDIKKQRLAELERQFYAQTGEQAAMVRALALSNRFIYTLKAGKSKSELKAMMGVFKALPGVLSVEEDILLHHTFTPDDPRYNEQWSFYENTGGINANTAWDQASGQGVVVAVLDTGYTNHQDLIGNILPGFDFISDSFVANDGGGRDNDAHDPGDWMEPWDCGWNNPSNFIPSSWHGTHVSGTIAATTHNSVGVSGVSHGANILPVRVLGKCGGYLSDIADAIVWASGGKVSGVPANSTPAQVISMSLGASGACSSVFQAAINQAISNGTSVIAAAGNNRQDASNHQPSNCNGVVSVASNDRQGNLAYYSNYGNVTITAPGGETISTVTSGILSTLNTGSRSPNQDSYAFYQGTSMATPHVAGTAALIYQLAPNTTPSGITQILTNTARTPPGNCNSCGAGIVDAAAAVASLQTANHPPNANFDYSTTDLTVSFTDTSSDSDGNIVSWHWLFGDGNQASSQNAVHTFNIEGDYSVTLTVTDDAGASNSISKTVSVAAVNSAPIELRHKWVRITSSGGKRIRLLWRGATSSKVDIYVNGEWFESTTNDGRHTNRLNNYEESSVTYQLCEANSATCSNHYVVEF